MQFAGSSTGTTLVVETGSYNVTEAEATGYGVSYSTNCSGYLNEGGLVRCVVTNDDVYVPPAEADTGTLIVIKEVVNDQGGELGSSDFNLSINLTTSSTTSTISFAGNASGTEYVLEVGDYTVTEDSMQGYQGTMSDDCSGYLADGEVRTCTITNNDYSNEPNAKLIVIKEVINDNGLSGVSSDFTINVEYTAPKNGDTAYTMAMTQMAYVIIPTMATTSFPGNASGTEMTVGPGDYSVTEETYDNYDTTYSEDCTGTILAGQTRTCTITNNDKSQGGGGGGYVPPTGGGGGGGGGSTGGILDPTPAPTPRVLGVEDEAPLCVLTEVEALYVSSIVNEILGHLGIERDVSLEEYFNALLTPRVVPTDLSSTLLAAVQNFVNYGTASNLRLGQGERAGVVNSFRAVYSRVPLDECDWQNAIKIGNTTLPLNLNTDREKAVEDTFKTIYGRSADRGQSKDDIAIKIMTYGIRPQIRDLSAEDAAIGVFERIYGKKPETASEWDANRALAYSGLSHAWMSSNFTNAASRMMSIRVNNEPIR